MGTESINVRQPKFLHPLKLLDFNKTNNNNFTKIIIIINNHNFSIDYIKKNITIDFQF